MTLGAFATHSGLVFYFVGSLLVLFLIRRFVAKFTFTMLCLIFHLFIFLLFKTFI